MVQLKMQNLVLRLRGLRNALLKDVQHLFQEMQGSAERLERGMSETAPAILQCDS